MPRGTMTSELDLVKEPSHLLVLLQSELLVSQPVPELKKKSLKEYDRGTVQGKCANKAVGSHIETSRNLQLPGYILN